MADEITDSSNWGKFIICIRWVDETLDTHIHIRLYKLDSIKSDTIPLKCQGTML